LLQRGSAAPPKSRSKIEFSASCKADSGNKPLIAAVKRSAPTTSKPVGVGPPFRPDQKVKLDKSEARGVGLFFRVLGTPALRHPKGKNKIAFFGDLGTASRPQHGYRAAPSNSPAPDSISGRLVLQRLRDAHDLLFRF